MKNKTVTLPSINSSPAINTFVSTWDSYYLHIQTLHVPSREGSHRLWLHRDLFVYNSIKVWEGCSRCYLNNEKAPKPCLETWVWVGAVLTTRAPLHPFTGQVNRLGESWLLSNVGLKAVSPQASSPRVKKKWHQINSCTAAEVPEVWIIKFPTWALLIFFSRVDFKNRG